MTRIGRRLRGWTNGVLDLPQDVLQELPRITLIGNKELYIENHRGVLHFSSGQLTIALANGSLEISGQELMIRNILGQELAVEGIIGEIRYKEARRNHERAASVITAGFVTLRVTGPAVENFINAVTEAGIVIWEVKPAGDGATLNLLLDDFFSLRPFLKKTGCRMHVTARSGLPFRLARLWRRKLFRPVSCCSE